MSVSKTFDSENKNSHGVEGQIATSQQQHFHEYVDFSDLYVDVVSPPFQSCEDEIRRIVGVQTKNVELMEPKASKSHVFMPETFEILRKYRSRHLKVDEDSLSVGYNPSATSVSTEATIRLAAEKFVGSMLNHRNQSPLSSSLFGVDSEEVELINNLLFSAHKLAQQNYEEALEFLKECDKQSTSTGTIVQRLVFYFSEALSEKIALETGGIPSKDSRKKPLDPLESVTFLNMDLMIAFHKKHPLAQITKLVGVQAVLDHVHDVRKLHVVDLGIRSGVHWTILMQALSSRRENNLHHLKITAVGTKSWSVLEDAGRRLESFARSLNIEFSYRSVLVDDISDLHQDQFDLEIDESVIVYSSYPLMALVGRVDELNHLMRVMRRMKPCVMVVAELEANCNSPSFVGRFVESLFVFGAFFDSVAECFGSDETSRANAEALWFRPSISNIVAADGDRRMIRHVTVDVWRVFFARIGFVEIELSGSCLDQARLGLRSVPCGNSCTVFRDGRCLTLGWKGTPICSLSVWKLP